MFAKSSQQLSNEPKSVKNERWLAGFLASWLIAETMTWLLKPKSFMVLATLASAIKTLMIGTIAE